MSLDSHVNQVLSTLLLNRTLDNTENQELINCIDLTLLDEHASDDALTALYDKASQYPVAALCVYAQHLPPPTKHLKLATVVNFPAGDNQTHESLQEIAHAKKLGVAEIDFVFPYSLYLTGAVHSALDHCQAVIDACRHSNLKLKVIMETGALPNAAFIYDLARKLIDMGCDVLKTSTGTIAQGASFSAVMALLSAIKDSGSSCGIKVSGGVKTPEQAQAYVYLAESIMGKKIHPNWFRIGASSLLDSLSL